MSSGIHVRAKQLIPQRRMSTMRRKLPPLKSSTNAQCNAHSTTNGIQQKFTGVYMDTYGNDPSAGSPTETLLRLLLPLDDQVCFSSRCAGGEPPNTAIPEAH